MTETEKQVQDAAKNGAAPTTNGAAESVPVDASLGEAGAASAPGDEHAPASNDPAEEEAPKDPLQAAEEKAAALKDQLLRTAADFDNFRKRSRREVEEARSAGRHGLLRDLLPVFDNLERACAASDAAQDLPSFVSGIEMVLKQFADSLKRAAIERVETVGKAFDPNIHEAIQQLVSDEFEPGQIITEVQAGYRVGERLIRPAMVVVAKAAEGE